MDYYELLGVSRSASEKELKSAFKKKAMQYHPDKGGDSEKFKQVNEAYQTLSDKQKRQMYDQFGTADPQNINQPNQFHFNAGNMGDIFSQMFNDTNNFGFSFTQPRRQQKNKDIRLHYTLNLKEVYTGTGATISFKLPNGRNEVIDVKIPAGMQDNDHVKFQGYGDDSIAGLPRGDLIVTIKVSMPPKWRRDKQNLYTKINVGLLDLITGTNIEVNTPEGKTISLNIPAGTKPNTTFSIPGHGIPVVRSNVRGALYVEIGVIMPRLNDEQINAIERIKRDITK
tara:strand:- start:631 stop:1479 length:849 start_codon:yes stop_codon:yes gene_type:complete